jgi:hypothetical protein
VSSYLEVPPLAPAYRQDASPPLPGCAYILTVTPPRTGQSPDATSYLTSPSAGSPGATSQRPQARPRA